MASVLITGSGGREHALGWALERSEHVDELFFAGGNAGTAEIGENIDIAPDQPESIVRSVGERAIDYVLASTDAAVANGVVDALPEGRAFGPTKAASRLEWDNIWANDFVQKHGVMSAAGEGFASYEAALDYIYTRGKEEVVVKANGLAAGKGAEPNGERVEGHLYDCMKGEKFGAAGRKVLIQEKLSGPELSVFAICDGEDYVLLPSFRDYKRLLAGDKGPNTGGMGCFGPVELSDTLRSQIETSIIRPTLTGMAEEGAPYSGALYCGLILTQEGPKLIEYNARFGDPETQGQVMHIENDMFELLFGAMQGSLQPLRQNKLHSVVVALASENYPSPGNDEALIRGLDREYPGVTVFHGTPRQKDGDVLAGHGRALYVTGVGESVEEARKNGYGAIGQHAIHFSGAQYREDIAEE